MKNMIQRFIILIIASLTALSAKAQGATTLEGGNDYANTGYEVAVSYTHLTLPTT